MNKMSNCIKIPSATYDESVSDEVSKWASLVEFQTFYNNMWCVTRNPGNRQCELLQQFICKHVLSIAVRYQEITVPEEEASANCHQSKARSPSEGKKAKSLLHTIKIIAHSSFIIRQTNPIRRSSSCTS